MKFSRIFTVIDSHAAGESLRLVMRGLPKIRGQTMMEKKQYLKNNLDFVRTSLMQEPRGHNNLFGSVLTEPTVDEADFGAVFMDCNGYYNMCGHGCIAIATIAVETGLVAMVEPLTEVVIDTPAGLIKAQVSVREGTVKDVTIQNVPSFLYQSDVELVLPDKGKVILDIAYGGNFYAIVNSQQLTLEVKPGNINALEMYGQVLREMIKREVKIQHPEVKYIDSLDGGVIFYNKSSSHATNYKEVVINGAVDRSPCGTGTSAMIATLYAKGKLEIDEELVNESIIGTLFRARAVKEVKVGHLRGIIPEITGAAYITGFNHWVIDPDDPLKYGFLVR